MRRGKKAASQRAEARLSVFSFSAAVKLQREPRHSVGPVSEHEAKIEAAEKFWLQGGPCSEGMLRKGWAFITVVHTVLQIGCPSRLHGSKNGQGMEGSRKVSWERPHAITSTANATTAPNGTHLEIVKMVRSPARELCVDSASKGQTIWARGKRRELEKVAACRARAWRKAGERH